LRAARGDQLADLRADDVEREVGDVGHATGQRDDLGAVGDGEESSYSGHLEAVRALGVRLDVTVEAGIASGLLKTHPA